MISLGRHNPRGLGGANLHLLLFRVFLGCSRGWRWVTLRYGDWEGRCYNYLYESSDEEEPEEEEEGALVGLVGAGDTAVQRRHGGEWVLPVRKY